MVISALGELARFIPHKTFTKIQEGVIPALLDSNEHAVVAAPTGSGKTLLLEVAMLKLFRRRLGALAESCESRAAGPMDRGQECGSAKAVYVCPIKALAHEKHALWSRMLAPLSVVIETGDQDHGRQQRQREAHMPSAAHDATDTDNEEGLDTVATADVIITTPERWDSITRRWKERTVLSIVNSVGLLLLDEVHAVHEDRGAALEAIVSRMKAIKAQQQQVPPSQPRAASTTAPLRFVAISGTLPNVEDFAEWLQVKPHMTFSFSAQDRPVPLTIKVLGFASDSNNPFAFDRFLSFRLFGLIRQHSQGRPTLVFCASRKEAAGSALRLVADIRAQAAKSSAEAASCHWRSGPDHLEPSQAVLDLANTANDKQLHQCLLLGIAFHHAAMTMNDRLLVERMFREQFIAVMCATTTLALGVNLPAHLVVVKGTTFFKAGKRGDLPLSEVAQMCGRAGRPGQDDHGVALVLTTESKVRLYENLVHGDVFTTVESQLHRSMIEHVNAEVALRTIHSFASGMDWIRTTFFWIRLRRCPQHYGLKFATKAEEAAFQPEAFAERLMQRVLTALHEEECIEVRCRGADALRIETDCPAGGAACVSDPNAALESTRIGRNMSRLYILFDTVKTFNDEVRERQWRSDGMRTTEVTAMEEEGQPRDKDHPEEPANTTGEGDEGEGEQREEDADAADDTGVPAPSNGSHASTSRRQRLFAQGVEPAALRRPFLLPHVLALCCRSAEFDEVGLRQGDKGPLNEMNKLVKFPLKGGHKGGREVRENWHKSYVLLQGQLAQIAVAEVSLRNDVTRLWSVMPRVTRFLCEYARFTGSYTFYIFAHLLLRCVEQRVWPDGLVLRQLDSVSDAVAKSLSRAGFRDFDSVRTADPRKLEAVCGRLPPYGSQLQAQARAVLRWCMSVEPLAADWREGGPRRFKVSITPSQRRGSAADSSASHHDDAVPDSDARAARVRQKGMMRSFLLVAGVPRSDRLLLLRYVSAEAVAAAAPQGESPCVFEFTVPSEVAADPSARVELAFIPEHWVGADVTLTLNPHPSPREAVHHQVPVSSDTNESGQLCVATAMTGSHSIVEMLAKGKASGGNPHSADADGVRPREKRQHALGSGDSRAAGTDPVEEGDMRSEQLPAQEKVAGAESLAAVPQDARASFEDMLEDLRYIHGERCTPSKHVTRLSRTNTKAPPTPAAAGRRKQTSPPVASATEATPLEHAVDDSSHAEAAFPAPESAASDPVHRSPVQKRQREEDKERDTDPLKSSRTPIPEESTDAPPATVARRVNFSTASAAVPSPSDVANGDAAPRVRADGTSQGATTNTVRIRRQQSPDPRQQQPPLPQQLHSRPASRQPLPMPPFPQQSLQTVQPAIPFFSGAPPGCGAPPEARPQPWTQAAPAFGSLAEEYAFRQQQLAAEYQRLEMEQQRQQQLAWGQQQPVTPATGYQLAPPVHQRPRTSGQSNRFHFSVQVNPTRSHAPPAPSAVYARHARPHGEAYQPQRPPGFQSAPLPTVSPFFYGSRADGQEPTGLFTHSQPPQPPFQSPHTRYYEPHVQTRSTLLPSLYHGRCSDGVHLNPVVGTHNSQQTVLWQNGTDNGPGYRHNHAPRAPGSQSYPGSVPQQPGSGPFPGMGRSALPQQPRQQVYHGTMRPPPHRGIAPPRPPRTAPIQNTWW